MMKKANNMMLQLRAVGRRRRNNGSRVSGVSRYVESVEPREMLSTVTVQLGANHDTTIYNSVVGQTSNGSGEYIIVGGSGGNSVARRGLVSFDVASAGIPQGATILDVVLTLNLNQSVGSATSVGVHRLAKPWGESSSNASGNEFEGDVPGAFDATWLFSTYDATAWASAGGDFAGASAAATVMAPGAYEWSGAGLIADVQAWLDSPAANFGWLLKSSEIAGVIKGFDSRNSPNAAVRPRLEITYEEPVVPTVVEGRKWHDRNADGIRQGPELSSLKLSFQNGKNFFGLYGGNEYWYRSASDQSWYFLTPEGDLKKWSGQAGRLTGTTVAQVGVRAWHNPNALLASNLPGIEEWMNGFSFELVNSSGVTVATVVSTDIDLNGDQTIQEETERGWYRFTNVAAGTYSVREIVPNGWAQTAARFSGSAATVWQLDQTLGLSFTGNLHENFGGRGERWLRGSSAWYYITPAGEFYRWNGKAVTPSAPLSGSLLASPGVGYFRDVSLLHSPENPSFVVNTGNLISRLDFGNYQPVSVQGRSWTEVDPNGQNNFSELTALVSIFPPSGAPQSLQGMKWYHAIVGNSGNTREAMFYITSSGQVFEWSAQGGSILVTTISSISGLSASAVAHYAFVEEAWVNGVTVELIDASGNVVAQMVTSDTDRNGDMITNPQTERGWYQFTNLLPGKYTVRQIAKADHLITSSSTPEQFSQVRQLADTYGFKAGATDSFNYGGRNERWFLSRSNVWHYMTPDGKIFEWDRNSGGSRGLVKGREIARLNGSYFVNLNLLFAPVSPEVTLASGQTSQMNLGQTRVIDTVFASIASQIT